MFFCFVDRIDNAFHVSNDSACFLFCFFSNPLWIHIAWCFSSCLLLENVVAKVTDRKLVGPGKLQWRLMGMRVAALFHSDGHQSQLPSVAWQLWNVICLSAWLNSAYVYISVWGGWYVCLYSICTNVYHIKQLESLYLWVMRGRANLNSGALSHLAALHSAHSFWLVKVQDAANSLPDRAHCIITALMPSWAERRQPDQSVSLR